MWETYAREFSPCLATLLKAYPFSAITSRDLHERKKTIIFFTWEWLCSEDATNYRPLKIHTSLYTHSYS